jgi:hypothetical protein
MAMQTNKPSFTIGADPELFLMNKDGKLISSIGKVGGSKRQPRSIGQGCSVQEDNVAVEFNIAPADTLEKFQESINYSLEYLTKYAAEQGLFLSITASQRFPEDQLKHLRAKIFGCEPDFNAWTGQQNPRPTAADVTLRSCGGHVHIGSELDKIQLVRWCDVTLGLVSVMEDKDLDRRQLYGKAGAFRPKDYGVEYRTLSNYWIQTSEGIKQVYHRVEEAIERVNLGWVLDDKEGEAIQKVINESNDTEALKLMAEYSV